MVGVSVGVVVGVAVAVVVGVVVSVEVVYVVAVSVVVSIIFSTTSFGGVDREIPARGANAYSKQLYVAESVQFRSERPSGGVDKMQ